jgi:hypothetical protein
VISGHRPSCWTVPQDVPVGTVPQDVPVGTVPQDVPVGTAEGINVI